MKEETKKKILITIGVIVVFVQLAVFPIFFSKIFSRFDLLNEKLGSTPKKAILISLVENSFERDKYFPLCLNDNAEHIFDKPGTTRFVIYRNCFVRIFIEDKKNNLVYDIGEILPEKSAVIHNNKDTALCRTIAESCEEVVVISSGTEKTGEIDFLVSFKKG